MRERSWTWTQGLFAVWLAATVIVVVWAGAVGGADAAGLAFAGSVGGAVGVAMVYLLFRILEGL